jgi:hypothetical protein
MRKREIILEALQRLLGVEPEEVPDEHEEGAGETLDRLMGFVPSAEEEGEDEPMDGGVVVEDDLYLYLSQDGHVWEVPVKKGACLRFSASRVHPNPWQEASGRWHGCDFDN